MTQLIDQILYTIQIEPIITNGLSGNDGKYLELSNGQRITSINFKMCGNVQVMNLMNGNDEILSDDQVKILSFNINNNILNPIGNSTLTAIIESAKGYNLDNPLIDLFREDDIIRIFYESIDDNDPQQLMVGSIENININYGSNGLLINLNIGYLTNILSRSQLVQTQAQQDVSQSILTAYAPTTLQFGDFLNNLLNETYLEQTTISTKYFGGVGEDLALGKADREDPTSTNGSAINSKTYTFVVTPPTDTKLDIILQTLYPYQRIMYINPEGDLLITPLSTYFDEAESWKLKMDLSESQQTENIYIRCLNINITKNTAVIQNRAYAVLNQNFTQFNQSTNNNIGNAALTGVAIATPPQNLFPRAYDMVQSNLGLQTSFVLQTLDPNALLQNSGLLNTAINLPTLEGVTSVLNINNQNIGYNTINKQDPIKYIMSLYAARELAENLLNDLLVDITIPVVSTFSQKLGRFRKIPLNQMVEVPSVSNKLFDGQQNLFCYGFSFSFNPENGSQMVLNLCKPYVFTAFWADKLVEI